ncbi:MAG: 3-phosphoshikimate 1-carboxyvinyltransferase [Solirubrobacterales bacterium]
MSSRSAGSARFEPASGLRGELRAPPDKSISHRAALLGGFGSGTTRISRYLDSADTRSTLGAVEALGARVDILSAEAGGLEVEIAGFGLRGAAQPRGPIDVGNAGTLIRLVVGLLAGQEGRRFTLDGDDSIRRRPMARVTRPLVRMGAKILASDDDHAPLIIDGQPLQASEHRLTVASAQVKSCLLLAGLLATDGPTTVHEPAETRDHTERMLRAAGVRVSVARESGIPTDPAPGEIAVEPADQLVLPGLSVPGDPSSAAFHIVAGLITGHSDVRVRGVGLNPTRIGLLGILNRMGANIEVTEDSHEAGEPVGSVRARPGSLRGARVVPAEIALAIDELPLVGLLGCFAEGETVVTGAEELRHKESDRIAGVVDALRAMGGEAEALEDGFVVTGTGGLRGGVIDSRGDHRLAMLGAVAGLASREGVMVEGFDAAGVSYPGFEADLRSLVP